MMDNPYEEPRTSMRDLYAEDEHAIYYEQRLTDLLDGGWDPDAAEEEAYLLARQDVWEAHHPEEAVYY